MITILPIIFYSLYLLIHKILTVVHEGWDGILNFGTNINFEKNYILYFIYRSGYTFRSKKKNLVRKKNILNAYGFIAKYTCFA